MALDVTLAELSDAGLLALLIAGESANQPLAGQVAVACTVTERVKRRRAYYNSAARSIRFTWANWMIIFSTGSISIMGLAANCQGYRVDAAGKVVGVQLGIYAVAGSRYEVYSVRLRDEYEANGNRGAYCQVLDRNGVKLGVPVRMAWPWNGGANFSESALPGNPNNDHPLSNGYIPPALGPLAFYIGGHNSPASDIVYGVGLPLNRHVSFDIIFRERGAVVQPPIDPPVEPGDPALRDLALRVEHIERSINAFGRVWQAG